MKKVFLPAAISMMICGVAACNRQKEYHLTITGRSPQGNGTTEQHTIYAGNDSLAYSEATVLFFLASHAYYRSMPESRKYITKPETYLVVDKKGNDIDSALGPAKTELIKQQKKDYFTLKPPE